MSRPASQSNVIDGIDQAIQSIESQIRSQQVPLRDEQPVARSEVGSAAPAPAPSPPAQQAPYPQAPYPSAPYPSAPGATPVPRSQPSEQSRQAASGVAQGVLESASLGELTLFVTRLRQIRDWLQQDSRLLPVVDEFIGQQVAASEKRNTRRNVAIAGVTTVIGAVLGWLLSSLAAPSSLLSQVSQLFGR
jgi:hypothetical protein